MSVWELSHLLDICSELSGLSEFVSNNQHIKPVLQFASQGCLMDEDMVRLLGDWTSRWQEDIGKTCSYICRYTYYIVRAHCQRSAFCASQIVLRHHIWVTANYSETALTLMFHMIMWYMRLKVDLLSPHISTLLTRHCEKIYIHRSSLMRVMTWRRHM